MSAATDGIVNGAVADAFSYTKARAANPSIPGLVGLPYPYVPSRSARNVSTTIRAMSGLGGGVPTQPANAAALAVMASKANAKTRAPR